jgi:hypothetical protein
MEPESELCISCLKLLKDAKVVNGLKVVEVAEIGQNLSVREVCGECWFAMTPYERCKLSISVDREANGEGEHAFFARAEEFMKRVFEAWHGHPLCESAICRECDSRGYAEHQRAREIREARKVKQGS